MTGAPVTIRPARSADAPAITHLVRDAFSPEVRGATIYGARGASAWVRAHLALSTMAERTYTVAAGGRALLAAADVQRTGDTLFLAYIAVVRAARGRGLAAALLAAAIDGAAAPRHTTFALDVFTDNAVPRRWYGRLGLEEIGESAWWAVDLTAAGRAAHAGEVTVADYAAAVASQRAYGFSQFRVATDLATYTVGRLGSTWFRVSDPAALGDAALLATLHQLDGTRRLLVIGPRTCPPLAATDPPLATSIRMRAPLADVRARLAARMPTCRHGAASITARS